MGWTRAVINTQTNLQICMHDGTGIAAGSGGHGCTCSCAHRTCVHIVARLQLNVLAVAQLQPLSQWLGGTGEPFVVWASMQRTSSCTTVLAWIRVWFGAFGYMYCHHRTVSPPTRRYCTGTVQPS